MRSVDEFLSRPHGEPAFVGVSASAAPARPVLLRGERARLASGWRRFQFNRPAPAGIGAGLALVLLVSSVYLGAIRGGEYQAFVAANGGPGDVAARALGFGVRTVTLSGQARLSEPEVLALAGINPRISMPFFDVEGARTRLEKDPMVQRASVRKLYPDQIVIEIVERTPAAIWQKDGEVRAVASDGTPIDELRDAQLNNLPFVVGDGANSKLGQFLALLKASEELRPKIAAGVYVGDRRWNLRMKSGLDVKLPEEDPMAAMTTLLQLQRDSRILDRDILWLDLRTPGRVFARLSADAATARAEALSHAKKGAAP